MRVAKIVAEIIAAANRPVMPASDFSGMLRMFLPSKVVVLVVVKPRATLGKRWLFIIRRTVEATAVHEQIGADSPRFLDSTLCKEARPQSGGGGTDA